MNTKVTYLDRPFDWQERPLWFHLQGLSQTASGYGRKLTTTRVIRIHGEKVWRRVYTMIFSNAGSAYVIIKGTIYFVHDYDFSGTPFTE